MTKTCFAYKRPRRHCSMSTARFGGQSVHPCVLVLQVHRSGPREAVAEAALLDTLYIECVGSRTCASSMHMKCL